jgi:hypothetical protein
MPDSVSHFEMRRLEALSNTIFGVAMTLLAYNLPKGQILDGRCSRCQTLMMLERVSPGPIGFEHRLFECPKCDHVEINVIASDPFTSKAAGWLAGELRAPT